MGELLGSEGAACEQNQRVRESPGGGKGGGPEQPPRVRGTTWDADEDPRDTVGIGDQTEACRVLMGQTCSHRGLEGCACLLCAHTLPTHLHTRALRTRVHRDSLVPRV